MKKKLIVEILAFMLIFVLTGCNKENEKAKISEEEQIKTEEGYDNSEEQEEESVNEVIDMEDEADKKVQEESKPINILIYYNNDDATAFESEEVQIGSLSPEEVLNALNSKGVISSEVQINYFETTFVDGKATILLDLNNAFSFHIASVGSNGEYFIMGSICNTFLDAYDCEQIQITVEGKTLSTGHTEYSGYMTTFS